MQDRSIFRMPTSETYTYVTQTVVENFDVHSKDLNELLSKGDSKTEDASLILIELLMRFQAGALTSDQILQFAQSALDLTEKALLFCQIFDTFPNNAAFLALLSELKAAEILTDFAIGRFVDTATLMSLELVPKTFGRLLNTAKRDEFYTQKKFNLFQEEFEGWSLLINEMYVVIQESVSVGHALQVVESTIGHYRLDPNRVLDVLLEVFATIQDFDLAVAFLKASRWWPEKKGDPSSFDTLHAGGSPNARKILSLKLAGLQLTTGLQNLIAKLVESGFVSFGAIYSVAVTSTDMNALEKAWQEDVSQKVAKMSGGLLALATALGDDDDENQPMEESEKIVESFEESLNNCHLFQLLKAFLRNDLYWPSIYILSQYPYLADGDDEVVRLMHKVLSASILPLHELLNPIDSDTHTALASALPKVHPKSGPRLAYLEEQPKAKSLHVASMIPKPQNVESLLSISRDFLKLFGTKLAYDVGNFTKLCEIAIADLTSNSSKDIWLSFFRNYILPAIGSVDNDSVAVNKAFDVLRFYTPEERFNVYGELYMVLAKTNSDVKLASTKAERATRDILKRLSINNVQPMTRSLSRISNANPLACFLIILEQIESYHNLAHLVIESAAYFNQYAWENLVLALLMKLTTAGRSNMTANGLNDQQWIQLLASFIGKICQRYPGSIDLKTLLDYIMKALHNNDTSVLIILKEILLGMGGMKPTNNMTLHHINMINSSKSLRLLAYKVVEDTRYDRQHSAGILYNAFEELEMINELFILLQTLHLRLTSESQVSHLKVLTYQADELNSVMLLLDSFLAFFAPPSLKDALKPAETLIQDYDVPIVWAMEIWRPFRTEMALPDAGLSLQERFWSLSLHDINYLPSLYSLENENLKNAISMLSEKLQAEKKAKTQDTKRIESIRKELILTQGSARSLPRDQKEHRLRFESISAALRSESATWFDETTPESFRYKDLLELCILPRCVHSSFDAVFCASFLSLLHEVNHNDFSLVGFLHELISANTLYGTLFTSTPLEAENLGMFFKALIVRLDEWRLQQSGPFTKLSLPDMKEFKKSLFMYHEQILNDVKRSLLLIEYMSRRNALTFLKNIIDVFPSVEDHCEKLVELVEFIAEHESREDLKLPSRALIGHLKSRSKTWLHLWDFVDLSDSERQSAVSRREELMRGTRTQKHSSKAETQKAATSAPKEVEKPDTSTRKDELSKPPEKTISYDETLKSSATKVRHEVDKKRYDYYTKFESSKAQSSSSPSHDKKADDTVAKTVREDGNIAAKSDSDLFAHKIEPKGSISALKQKINALKQEYKENARTRNLQSKQALSVPPAKEERFQKAGTEKNDSERNEMSGTRPKKGEEVKRNEETNRETNFPNKIQEHKARQEDKKAEAKQKELPRDKAEYTQRNELKYRKDITIHNDRLKQDRPQMPSKPRERKEVLENNKFNAPGRSNGGSRDRWREPRSESDSPRDSPKDTKLKERYSRMRDNRDDKRSREKEQEEPRDRSFLNARERDREMDLHRDLDQNRDRDRNKDRDRGRTDRERARNRDGDRDRFADNNRHRDRDDRDRNRREWDRPKGPRNRDNARSESERSAPLPPPPLPPPGTKRSYSSSHGYDKRPRK